MKIKEHKRYIELTTTPDDFKAMENRIMWKGNEGTIDVTDLIKTHDTSEGEVTVLFKNDNRGKR